MEFERATARAMHDDHMAALTLLDGIERFVQGAGGGVPDARLPATRQLLSDFKAAVHSEITGHFAFEEESLFPILAEAGAEDMCTILTRDHEVILPLGQRLAELAGEAGRNGFTPNSWGEFRRTAGDFIDGLRGHIGKEEMGLVPALEDVLEEDQDMELIAHYRFS